MGAELRLVAADVHPGRIRVERQHLREKTLDERGRSLGRGTQRAKVVRVLSQTGAPLVLERKFQVAECLHEWDHFEPERFGSLHHLRHFRRAVSVWRGAVGQLVAERQHILPLEEQSGRAGIAQCLEPSTERVRG